MRNILGYALALAMAALVYGAPQAGPTKKAPPKTTAARTAGTTAKKSPAKSPAKAPARGSASAHKATTKKAPVTTWRNRQMTPTPERYKEIQDALVAKGYLRPEETGNGWNQASVDALRRFQGEQNIEASGKINSLSLIALGLGPKHDATTGQKPVEVPSGQDR